MLVPLAVPPKTRQVGVGFHGYLPTETVTTGTDWHVHLYRYEGELVIDGVPHQLEPGYASLAAPGSLLEYRFADDSMHLYAHMELPAPGPDSGGAGVEIPVVQDLAGRFPGWWNALEDALTYWHRQPARIDALLWHLLWDLAAERSTRTPDTSHWHHPALWRAIHFIRLHFPEPITVVDVAHQAGISHSRLTRLFRQATGSTVIGYIRSRRVAEAVKLLTRSELPIKAIAANVGIPDLHAFNKTVRALTGKPPRAFRHPE